MVDYSSSNELLIFENFRCGVSIYFYKACNSPVSFARIVQLLCSKRIINQSFLLMGEKKMCVGIYIISWLHSFWQCYKKPDLFLKTMRFIQKLIYGREMI